MASLIKTILGELANETRLIKNCYHLLEPNTVGHNSFIHNSPCLHIVIGGSLLIVNSAKQQIVPQRLTTNDVLFMNTDSEYSIINTHPVALITLLFEQQQLNCHLVQSDGNQLVIIEQTKIVLAEPEINPLLIQALTKLLLIANEQLHATKLAKLLIISLLNNSAVPVVATRQFSPNKHLRLSGIRQYINQHFQEPLTRQTLAQRFHLSPNYLSTLFHKEEKIGLNEYILQTKLRHAKKLLLDNELTISDVAIACGFQDDNYFRRIFRKKTGCTPSAYKQQHHTTLLT